MERLERVPMGKQRGIYLFSRCRIEATIRRISRRNWPFARITSENTRRRTIQPSGIAPCHCRHGIGDSTMKEIIQDTIAAIILLAAGYAILLAGHVIS